MDNRGRGWSKGTLLLAGLCCAALLLAGFRNGVEASPAAGHYAKASGHSGTGREAADVDGQAGTSKDVAAGRAGISMDAAARQTGTPIDAAAGKAGTPKETVALLADLGREVTEPGSPLRLVFKWQGSYAGEESTDAADSLSKSLGLQAAVKSEEEGHATYRSSAKTGELKTSLFWSELGEGQSYVIVTVETDDLSRTAGLAEAAERAGVTMESAGVAADWNVSLQGAAREQGKAGQALKRTERTLTGKLQGMQAAETYEDKATASISYTVPSISHTLRSGNRHLALQAAVHKDDIRGGNRITIGFPLITIEY